MIESVQDNRRAVNIGRLERVGSALAGGFMLFRGLKRGSTAGYVVAGGGALFLYRGIIGRSRLYSSLHVSGSKTARRAEAAVPYQTGIRVERTTVVRRQPEELYRFWRNPANLSLFLEGIEKVTDLGSSRSHWIGKGPCGALREWDQEIINDRPGELIGWRSTHLRRGYAGSVSFTPAPDGAGCEVKLTVEYQPLGGPPGAAVAALLGKSRARRIERDLESFKQLMETEVAGKLYGARR